ncbi:MAG: hypothetical protein O3A87_02250 [Verrucomicrobia bacterium]|nr:hypothetical protein [Verrucomicrobiota bacterium]MDA1005291.1 hypothetical protein [Verrucomicrobiota bacterium]
MDPFLYKVIHLVGVMSLFAALGAVAASEANGGKKLGTILHGVALLLILVSGFGLIAKLQYGFAWWVIAKIVIFLAMGGMLAVAKRRLLPCGSVIGIIIGLGTLAAVLGVYKGAF